MEATNMIRRFKRVLNDAGPLAIRIHDLRHTAASLLLLQGVNPKVVCERLGHADVSTTLRLYSHVLPSLQAEAPQHLDDLLGGGSFIILECAQAVEVESFERSVFNV
jgi:integrase